MEVILTDKAYWPQFIAYSIIASFGWPFLAWIWTRMYRGAVEETSPKKALLLSAVTAPVLAYTVIAVLAASELVFSSLLGLSGSSFYLLYLIASGGITLAVAFPIYTYITSWSIPTLVSERLGIRSQLNIFNTILYSLLVGFGAPFVILFVVSFLTNISAIGAPVSGALFAINGFIVFETITRLNVDITGNLIVDLLILLVPVTAFAVFSTLGFLSLGYYHHHAHIFPATTFAILTFALMFTFRIILYVRGA